MKLSPNVTAELTRLAASTGKGARLRITGTSMHPSLRAGMVVEVLPLVTKPRIGEILVFRSRDALVAHRLTGFESANRRRRERAEATGERIERYLTSGDAQPACVERLQAQLIVGRVGAVWSSAERDAKRIDGANFRRVGIAYARTRALRAVPSWLRAVRRLLATLACGGDVPDAVPFFATIRAATQACERGAFAHGFALFGALPRTPFLEAARRHHLSGYLWEWLRAAERSGVTVPEDLARALHRMRLANAVQSGRVLACVRAVRDLFDAAGLPHVFLKGGARLAVAEPGADAQFSSDVDVLVPAESFDRACSTLRAAGYGDAPNAFRRSYDDPWHHHCEALIPPGGSVPVEIHFALTAPRLASRPYTYAELRPYIRRVASAAGETNVLDEFGSAIHLAYHARDLHVWRDIVMLSRILRSFDAATRDRFDACIAAECSDALRLRSSVAAADGIVSDTLDVSREVRRYLAWADVREDLPSTLSCDVAEAIIGRCTMSKLHLHPPATVATWLRCWLRNMLSLPWIGYRLSKRATFATRQPRSGRPRPGGWVAERETISP